MRGISLFLACGLAACGDGWSAAEVAHWDAQRSAERWQRADEPEALANDLEYHLAALPTQGEAASTPWPGSTWPTRFDGINARWAGPGAASAVAKYQQAFGGDHLEDAVSRRSGVDACAGATACAADADCAAGLICARRSGRSLGRCIEGYTGLCHGWAPAAILTPEPRHPVVRNGVVFRVNDLKALVSWAYADIPRRVVSVRCDEKPVKVDRFGRPTSAACRDTNPGTLHVLMANLLGLQGRAFIVDAAMHSDVYNFPVRGFRIDTLRGVSRPEALRASTQHGPLHAIMGVSL